MVPGANILKRFNKTRKKQKTFKMKKEFFQRLEEYMKANNVNDNQMTKRASLSVGLIAKCRKNGKGMLSDNIEKILLACPDLSADWLLTGRGEMRKVEADSHNIMLEEIIADQQKTIKYLRERLEMFEGKKDVKKSESA